MSMPLDMDMIMKMREQAKAQQPQEPTGMQGAASRALEGLQGAEQPMPTEEPIEDPLAAQSPDEMIGSDQQYMTEQEEPPDIDQSAAKRMMQYGAVMDYLRQARGEINA